MVGVVVVVVVVVVVRVVVVVVVVVFRNLTHRRVASLDLAHSLQCGRSVALELAVRGQSHRAGVRAVVAPPLVGRLAALMATIELEP